MASFCPLSLTPIMDDDGVPIVGARIRFYDAGTTTPRTVYRDNLLGNAYDPNDIRTNASGRIPSIWVAGEPYRVVITKPGGQLIEEVDNLPVTEAGAGPGPGSDTAIETGDVVWAYRSGPRAGWVIPNGQSIGSATSGANGRANADCEALFKKLWEANALLAVSGGRGSNAASDWSSNKTIALPDMRGRTAFGTEHLGALGSGRFAGVTFSTGDAFTIGATAGGALVTLTAAQLPAITLSGTTDGVGNHTHTGSTDTGGFHAHSGSVTVSYPAHTYQVGAGGQVGGGPPPIQGLTGLQPANTVPPGPQTFGLSINGDGSHAHAVTTQPSGAHSHTVTIGPIGSGQAFDKLPWLILMTPYLKL